MGELTIDPKHWQAFANKKICFVPSVFAVAGEIENTALIAASDKLRQMGLFGQKLSSALIRDAKTAGSAMTIERAKALVRTINFYFFERGLPDRLHEHGAIRECILAVPSLAGLMARAGITPAALSAQAGVSAGAIEYLSQSPPGRGTAGMVVALHGGLERLGAGPPELDSFCTTDPDAGLIGVNGTPFAYADLAFEVPPDFRLRNRAIDLPRPDEAVSPGGPAPAVAPT